MSKISFLTAVLALVSYLASAQNYTFDFNTSGRRVCPVSSVVDLSGPSVKILFPDSLSNASEPLHVYRRLPGSGTWNSVATALPPGTGHWTDTDVAPGEIWEYQVKRLNTWIYQSVTYDATGYTLACLLSDNTSYKGRMILLVADDILAALPAKYLRLKKELTAEGWLVSELVVPRANSWDSGDEVVTIKNQISALYNQAPAGDKHKIIFILGHVPLPRCGSTDVVAPDDHNENKGARGCDAYYADLDGTFTDTATYNPAGLASSLAVNLPGDFKWDQDFFPSDIEMGFGRIDFADITELPSPEMALMEQYLDRLSHYRNVAPGFDMGHKSAFYFGYDNSNDGSYRSLLNISAPAHVYQNYPGPNHNQWVRQNGPFKVYMQNLSVPAIEDWQANGMDATLFSSDQSYWGFGDVPQPAGIYSRIRALLGVDSKCLVALWTTTGINIFHQACAGISVGEAMKEIMNHNPANQTLEKPAQEYDTPDWWNRTHFAIWGDPTITLFQIAPPGSVSLALDSAQQPVLQWSPSPDSQVIGYHVFESETEFGKYNRITETPVAGNRYVLPGYQPGRWYMARAVGVITSGCGQFLHSSIGKETEGSILLHAGKDALAPSAMEIFPNPGRHTIQIRTSPQVTAIAVWTPTGQLVAGIPLQPGQSQLDISFLPAGIYLFKGMGTNGELLAVATFVRQD